MCSKPVALVAVIVSLCFVACTPAKQGQDPLGQSAPSSSVVSSRVTGVAPVLPLFPELSLDMYAYPKAIVTQEDLILATNDTVLKRDAYLVLVALHMGRENPNQDFSAASASLDQALLLDPALEDRVSIQRWLDVFATLNALQVNRGAEGQLYADNEKLRARLKKQTCTITYLESTLEELRKVESELEKKKRLYR